MQKLVIGVFNEETNAQNALHDLEKHGFNPKDLSVIMKDRDKADEVVEGTGATVVGNAATGAAAGGALGALAGLLIGIGAITIPGLGAVLIGGPLAAALGITGAAATTVSGAATGALAGGLIGALTGLGVPENEARIYEERINEGGILLAVPARESELDAVEDIMDTHGADQIRAVTTDRKDPVRHEKDKTVVSDDEHAYRYR